MKRKGILFISIMLALITSELILRSLGYKAGVFLSNKDIQNYWYEYDQGKMHSYEFFKPDSLGIFKVNQDLVRNENNPPPDFGQIINALKHTSYNLDGFRGRDFSKNQTGKTSIFFIGDSYTFGFDAEPFDSCYVDLLEKINNKYITYNGGVPGADLATYATVAENYIPKIKPDIVVVCITKDDNVSYEKELKPYENSDIYFTSKGLLYKANFSYAKDSIQIFDDAQDAYDNLMIRYTSKYIKSASCKWIVNRSALVTIIVGKFLYKPDLSKLKHITVMPRRDYSKRYINRILNAAKYNNTKVVFTIIPKGFDEAKEMSCVRKVVGDSVKLFYPRGISKNKHYGHYHKAHFNNSGHLYYAQFLDGVISKELESISIK